MIKLIHLKIHKHNNSVKEIVEEAMSNLQKDNKSKGNKRNEKDKDENIDRKDKDRKE